MSQFFLRAINELGMDSCSPLQKIAFDLPRNYNFFLKFLVQKRLIKFVEKKMKNEEKKYFFFWVMNHSHVIGWTKKTKQKKWILLEFFFYNREQLFIPNSLDWANKKKFETCQKILIQIRPKIWPILISMAEKVCILSKYAREKWMSIPKRMSIYAYYSGNIIMELPYFVVSINVNNFRFIIFENFWPKSAIAPGRNAQNSNRFFKIDHNFATKNAIQARIGWGV